MSWQFHFFLMALLLLFTPGDFEMLLAALLVLLTDLVEVMEAFLDLPPAGFDADLDFLLDWSVLHGAPPEFIRWLRLRIAEHLSGQDPFDPHRLSFYFRAMEEGACQFVSSR